MTTPQAQVEAIPEGIPQDVWNLASNQVLADTGDMDADITLAIARAILADRTTRPPAGEAVGVTVKPLEWEAVSSNISDANGVSGLYRVKRIDGGWVAFLSGGTFRADRETEDEAKSAAQADYTSRILSALTTPIGAGDVKVVPVEPTEAMLRAGMDNLAWWVEPYTAPREGGVATENDMSVEDANYINEQGMDTISDLYAAMLAAAPSPAPPEDATK